MTTRSRGPYQLGTEIFRTKEAANAYIQEILYRYQDGQELGEDDLEFMIEVLKHHPRADEKIGVGVRGIRVQREAQWGTMQFAVIRTDGSDTDFSFKKCLYPVSRLQVFKKACRDLVANRIKQFRYAQFARAESGTLLCPITGETMTRIGSHVDHVPPQTFDALVERFINEDRIDVNGVEITGLADGEMRKGFADAMLAERWRAFHEKHARLRVVSAFANLSNVKRER
jgi:hypothetical protein